LIEKYLRKSHFLKKLFLNFFEFFFKNGGRAGSSPAIWVGPKLARPKANYFGRCMQNEFCMQRQQQ